MLSYTCLNSPLLDCSIKQTNNIRRNTLKLQQNPYSIIKF